MIFLPVRNTGYIMVFDTKIFGERLREMRLDKRITTVQLAEALGVRNGTISKWENAVISPTVASLYIIAKYFGVDADYLMGLKD